MSRTLANYGKPKPVEIAEEVANNRPVETAVEKAKRLRKEQRRKLRVTFKTGEALTEVRLFYHDPEEELGHDDSMIRGINDIQDEGKMMKMHKELEVDDEDDVPDVLDLDVAWYPPSGMSPLSILV